MWSPPSLLLLPASSNLPNSSIAVQAPRSCSTLTLASLSSQPQNTNPPSQLLLRHNPAWNPFQRLVSLILDKVEGSIITPLEKQHPLPFTTDPRVQLDGNFAPVSERPVQHQLQVDGNLPDCIEGVYVRNGANPMFEPVAGHHLFDGDGMLHAVHFKHGTVSYCCRFTRTHRLTEEKMLGRAFYPKAIGELHGYGGVARLLLFHTRTLFALVDARKGMGVANAGVIFFNGNLLAMSEDDLPYVVRVTQAGDLETIGRYDFAGQLTSAMIAHPKVDAQTGEMFALSYDVIKKPYLRYFKIAADGKKGPDVAISLSQPTMIHDFAITKNFVVIPDQQIVFRMQEMLTGGSPVLHDKNKISRFGVLPRDDFNESRIKWIDVPADSFYCHLCNAWEDGEEVVVIASCMTPADGIFNESDEALRSTLSEVRLNIRAGSLSSKKLIAPMNLEAGQVNRNYLGRKSRFAYFGIVDPWPKVSGIVKVDLQPDGSSDQNIVGKILFKHGCFGGEPFFVPRISHSAAQEDDGYLLTFMHNEESGRSELLVLDAKSPILQLVASVKLPSRVPYGFHGTFISAQGLETQQTEDPLSIIY